MNGVVIPNTPIAVDFWKLRRNCYARLFFLTHMHSDHTVGLTSTWKHPIYCSAITGRILHHKLQVDKDLIRPLEVSVAHKINLDELGVETMTVTLIDANHCPGSVMFLFEGYFGTILYTGDFRYHPAMFQLTPLSNNKKIDILYLDNTNCNVDHNIPSRQQATVQIKDIISRHPEHNVVIGLYTIGKETLLIELAKEFKTWIVVTPERLELLKLLELEDVFTAEEGAGRIRVVEQSAVNYGNMNHWNNNHPTIAILPTSRPARVWHQDVHVVPYSDHSSFQELVDFVGTLKPSSLEPVVKTKMCEVLFKDCLNSPKKTLLTVTVPISVRAFMKDAGRRDCAEGRKAARRPVVTALHNIPKGVLFESPEKYKQSTKDICNMTRDQKATLETRVEGSLASTEDDSKRSPFCCQREKECAVLHCDTDSTDARRSCDSSPRVTEEEHNVLQSRSTDHLLQSMLGVSSVKESSATAIDAVCILSLEKCTGGPSDDRRVAQNRIQPSMNIEQNCTKGPVPAREELSNGAPPVKGFMSHANQMAQCTDSSSLLQSSFTPYRGLVKKYPLVPLSQVIDFSADQFHRQIEKYFEKMNANQFHRQIEKYFEKMNATAIEMS